MNQRRLPSGISIYLMFANVSASTTWRSCAFINIYTDRKGIREKTYVDINSEELRDLLRAAFDTVKGVSLREDKPSVGISGFTERQMLNWRQVDSRLLYVFLPEIRTLVSETSQ